MHQCPIRKVPAIGRIAPPARAEPIKQNYGSVGAHLISDPLHQHGLAHTAGAVNDERAASFPRPRDYFGKHVSLNDIPYLWECVRRWIEAIFVVDLQLCQDGHAINPLVGFATRTGLDSDEVPQF